MNSPTTDDDSADEGAIPSDDDVRSLLDMTGFTNVDDLMDKLNSRDEEVVTIGEVPESGARAKDAAERSFGCCSAGAILGIMAVVALIGIVAFVVVKKGIIRLG